MSEAINNPLLTNEEIYQRFSKYIKLKYKPLGMYFSDILPEGKIHRQGKILKFCVVEHVFRAANRGGISILDKDHGCPGGRWWTGFSKVAPRGLAGFLANGRDGSFGGRAERFKKNVKVAVGVFKEPGPVKQPKGANFIIYQRLKNIPDSQHLEFILFFANPMQTAKLITLCNYGQHVQDLVRAPGGSGCMSVLNHPLQMKEAPEYDAVLGVWDLFARSRLPKNVLSLAVRPWFAREMARDIPGSFLGHDAPFTTKGELKLLFKKLKEKLSR